MQNHHLTSVSTSPQKIAQQNFFTVEPISGIYTLQGVEALRTCIVTRKRGRPQSYTVYDALGTVVLITTNKTLAERYTRDS